MKTTNLKPAFQYRFRNNARGIAIFFVIMIVILLFVSFGFLYFSVNGQMSGSYSAFGLASAITVFIIGITSIREDLRLFLQNGVGRRTVFLTALLTSLSVAMLLAVAGELLLTAGQAITASHPEYAISDLFYLMYTHGAVAGLPFSLHIQSILFSLFLFTCANLAGMFLSLLFYRLNKVFTLIVAIGGPIFTFTVLPILLYKCRISLDPFAEFLLSGPWALISFLVAASALFGLLNYLLLRRAPVRPAK